MALLRSAATVGSYTLLSRVCGFLRDILTAAILGTAPVADAFFVAQRLPNLFRSLFAEGAFSAAFVPLFAGTMAERGRAAAHVFAEEAFAALFVALIVFVVLGEIFMPALMAVIAPGFDRDPDKFALVVTLTRITFPYLLFISLVSLQAGILNSVDRFAAAAATPILLNLFLIAALLLMARFGWRDGDVLAWAVTLAGLAQFLWLMGSCARAGFGLRLRWPRLTPAVRRALRIMGPGVLGAGVTQINVVVSTALASLLPEGSISYLWYAERLNQLPLGVVGIAVGTAILPSLSRQVRGGDADAARHTQNRALELALLLAVPAAVGLALLAGPILSALFQRGAFRAGDAAATAPALAAYAAGLPAFVLVKVLVPGFFARQDTATPVKIAGVAMLGNLLLSLSLMPFLAHVGLAAGLAAAGWINAALLYLALRRREHFRLDGRARANLPRIALAAAGMGLLLWLLKLALAGSLAGPLLQRIGALTAMVCAGLALFALLAIVFGVADWRLLRRLRDRDALAPASGLTGAEPRR
ncbi:MAG: murein biosynthesis integral membrane protein MurJ [Alphaproteobacteria bacterium]|nr:murein biosynthesis integral membrane protein MurJ [Alphaproteobacteria bacterium]